jgi:DNA-binding winged helix-turn-helix (wHTH) protein/WD40 repeat protein
VAFRGESSTVIWREFQLGKWRVRPQLNELVRGDEVVHLEAKSIAVLVDLAQHAGKVRSKRRLLRSVWGDAFVTDDVLTHAIWELRKALGDDPKDPHYIQTIPRKGYRLVAEVAWEPPTEVRDERFPYRLGEQLGAGAMGVVYRAEDTRLRRTVALKFLPRELSSDRAAKDRFLREARAAAKLDHAHIAVVYDVGESPDGRMYLAMAHYPGESLKQKLAEGALPVEEAVDLACQIAEGLAAAHGQGIVHRDIKPANVMLTEEGQTKIVDFGLARGAGDTTLTRFGSTVGTVLYMSPEQARGKEVDPRSDLWSLGVTLYEMVSGERPFKGANDQAVLYSILHEEPVKLSVVRPEVPPGLEAIVDQCLEKDVDSRYQKASSLAQDLAAVLEGRRWVPRLGEEVSPYPGLAPFTEEKASFFFGRDQEVGAMWEKLRERGLLALIGPSGAGKTSFVRAGVIPSRPEGWRCLVCTPGSAPFVSLGQALVPELAGDPEALRELFRFHKPETAFSMLSRWRRRFDEALLVVDQFEELFTLNPPEVQVSFAELLGRLTADGDLHVLLSLRDDFLIHCHEHPALSPVFEALLTPLTALRGPALRQALVEPAAALGYAFEEDSLVEEMVAEVEEERGALPLVAFTAARLWEKRDRDNGVLTREACEAIGGVGGALARHAEATLERIGGERVPIVREIFRNLVTAQGTRSARDREELLSVFEVARPPGPVASPNHAPHLPEARRTATAESSRRAAAPAPVSAGQRELAARVLDTLIDARLLTSYEVTPAEGEENGHHRIEIIHESLLANWPRLVRWQTQDAEGAQLRDELRQAAQMWNQHDRGDDYLWTGAAYLDFLAWRERYPGKLTELEEEFADALVSHAGRRARRRRLAVAAVISVLAVGLGIVAAFWQKSIRETRRAEAQKLIAVGQAQLEDYPTAALAHATQSLALADSEEARLLALQALWEGPTAFIVNDTPSAHAVFSPGGTWLVQNHELKGSLSVISRDGTQRVMDQPSGSGTNRWQSWFLDSEDLFLSAGQGSDRGRRALWSAPEGRFLAWAGLTGDQYLQEVTLAGDSARPRVLSVIGAGNQLAIEALYIDGSRETLGEIRLSKPVRKKRDANLGEVGVVTCFPSSGDWLGVVDDHEVSVFRIGDAELLDRRRLGRYEGDVKRCRSDPQGRFFLTITSSGGTRRWDPSGKLKPADLELPPDAFPYRTSRDGSFLMAAPHAEHNSTHWSIWSIGQASLDLVRRIDLGGEAGFNRFDPNGPWLAMQGPHPTHRLWSLAAPAGAEPIVLRRGAATYAHVPAISRDGKWLATNDQGGLILWPLVPRYPAVINVEFTPYSHGVRFGLDGRFLATAAADGKIRLWPLVGLVPAASRVVFESSTPSRVRISPEGELFASGGMAPPSFRDVWIGKAGEKPTALSGADELTAGTTVEAFSRDGRFVAATDGWYDPANTALHVWEVATGEEVAVLRLEGEEIRPFAIFVEGKKLITGSTKGVLSWDIDTAEIRVLVETRVRMAAATEDGRRLLLTQEREGVSSPFGGGGQDPAGSPSFFDLDTGEVTALTTHGLQVRALALNNEGTVAVTGDSNGIIRVGPVTGEEPHLLLGHKGEILGDCLAIDPLGRWIASCGIDKTLRLWPMPDLSKPPLHTLPREELIAKLKTLTNVRIERDPDSSTGWTLTHEPFPGWETVPTW